MGIVGVWSPRVKTKQAALYEWGAACRNTCCFCWEPILTKNLAWEFFCQTKPKQTKKGAYSVPAHPPLLGTRLLMFYLANFLNKCRLKNWFAVRHFAHAYSQCWVKLSSLKYFLKKPHPPTYFWTHQHAPVLWPCANLILHFRHPCSYLCHFRWYLLFFFHICV